MNKNIKIYAKSVCEDILLSLIWIYDENDTENWKILLDLEDWQVFWLNIIAL